MSLAGTCGLEPLADAFREAVAAAMPTVLAPTAEQALRDNDAHGYFGRIGGQIVTGPTLTNVNDFRAILLSP